MEDQRPPRQQVEFAADMMHTLHKFLLFHLLSCLGFNALGSEIIKGKKVPENLMPYMASVQNNEGHVCGGFLISEDFVVTAAHCDDGNPTSVVLGTHNLKKVDKTMRYAVKRCKHPSFVNVSMGNDIMLLKLSKKARLGKTVGTIRLPRTEVKLRDNEKCRVAGWGYIKTGGVPVDLLRMVDVPIVNPGVCKRIWRKLPNNVICAGGYKTTKGTCQGDSGGPLVCGGTAVGIVSFNLKSEKNCDYPNVPNVYTNISKYLDWIKRIGKKKNC